jgi:hypothetical protein
MFDSNDSIVASSAAQLSADLGGEFVILGVSDGLYYGLDGTGARIWELIQEPRSIRFLEETISKEFEIDSNTCAGDIQSFLNDLSERSFIEIVRAQTS